MLANNQSEPLSHLATDLNTGHLWIVVEYMPILPNVWWLFPEEGRRNPKRMGTISLAV